MNESLSMTDLADQTLRGLAEREGVIEIALIDLDGQVIWHKGHLGPMKLLTISSLMAGMIAAGRAVTEFIEENLDGNSGDLSQYSTSHETRNRGIYTLPVSRSALLIALYRDLKAPAELKMRLRLARDQMVRNLEVSMEQNRQIGSSTEHDAGGKTTISADSHQPLFENISDDEIESMFNF